MKPLSEDQQTLVTDNFNLVETATRKFNSRYRDWDACESDMQIALCVAARGYIPARGTFEQYFWFIAKFHVIDHLRREAKQPKRFSDTADEILELIPDEKVNRDPPSLYRFQPYVSLEEYSILHMKYIEGLSHKDIADELDLAPQTVAIKISHLYSRLSGNADLSKLAA